MQDNQKYISELKFCLKLREEEWWCTFAWWNKCDQCAVPYLLYKFISWEVLHWDIERLTLENRKQLVEKI